MYQNIPMELRQLRQWVCWRHEVVNGRNTKVPYTPDGSYKADVNSPGTWGTFEQACNTATGPTMEGIGLVLTDADPYTGIDIDDKQENPASEEERIVQVQILELFQSYTERSPGARWHDEHGRERGGYHIIIRGKLNGGRDRGHVGVYSSRRYLTFTGDVVRNAPIGEYQQLLEKLVAQMPGGEQVALADAEGTMDDLELHEMAMRAANGAKYDELCRGDWAAMGYPSQSEADFALLSIIAFYTRDNEQVRRLFRYSALGKRDKATRDNRYIDAALRKIRAKEPAPADYTALAETAARIRQQAAPVPPPAPPPAPVATATPNAPAPVHAPARKAAATYPPGLVGEVAAYIYSSSVRPTHEVAILYAIAFLAGVVGRSYNISGTGLNQYLLLVATTGTGKEDGAKGIERIMASVRPNVAMVDQYIGPGAFASGQALIRVLDERPCFLSMLGEFGLTLQALNDPRAPAAVIMLKRVLLDLYSKSGWNNVLRSTAYSDSEKNTKTIHAPAVSWVGDTTPETLYDNISSADIADGLLPRVQILEYTGKRPKRNRSAGHAPPQELSARVADLVALALTTANNNTCAAVQVAADALVMLDTFDEECDDHMNASSHGGVKQLWNRAHLKALKLAGLLAVGCNPHQPTVTLELAEWAIAFTRSGTDAILRRFEEGDVGDGESKQASDLRRVVSEYFRHSKTELKSYKVDPALQKAGLVPYAYLVVRVTRLRSYYRDRIGAAGALKRNLELAVNSEHLTQLMAGEAMTKFNTRQALYYPKHEWLLP